MGNPFQYSWLENPADRGAWWAAVHKVSQSQTRLKWHSMHTCIGEGNGNPLQYSGLENPADRGAWWAAVHRVAQSRTRLKQLSMHTCIGEGNGNPLQCSCLENPRDGGAWWAAIYGVAQSRTRLKWLSAAAAVDVTCNNYYYNVYLIVILLYIDGNRDIFVLIAGWIYILFCGS